MDTIDVDSLFHSVGTQPKAVGVVHNRVPDRITAVLQACMIPVEVTQPKEEDSSNTVVLCAWVFECAPTLTDCES